MAKQIELSDPYLSLEARAEWLDLRRDEYCVYAGYLESALALLKKRTDAAGKYAREAFTRELKALNEALSAVPSIELERSALKAALRVADDARSAIDTASTVADLVNAKASAELSGRAVAVAFDAFKSAATASRLKSAESFPLFRGRVAALAAISDLNRHRDTLSGYAPFSGSTFNESAAVDTARGWARSLEANALPWVFAKTDADSLTFRLFFSIVARIHGIEGAVPEGRVFA
jgi:hypothetical protein